MCNPTQKSRREVKPPTLPEISTWVIVVVAIAVVAIALVVLFWKKIIKLPF